MFVTPMSWTRVKEVQQAAAQRITIWDVEQDIMADQSLKKVRSESTRQSYDLLFDPESYRDNSIDLTCANHTLDRESLLGYAKIATKIRHMLSHKHDSPNEESKSDQAEPENELEHILPLSSQLQLSLSKDDIQENHNPCNPQNKKLTLRKLNSATRLQIIKLATSKVMTHADIALRYNVKLQLVSDLVRFLKKDPIIFLKKKQAEIKLKKQNDAINSSLEAAFVSKRTIWSSKQIASQAQNHIGFKVSNKAVISAMKNHYGLSYRKIRRVPNAGNSERNLVLRSLYAQRMLQVYKEGKHVINIDETWIPETDFRRRCWNYQGQGNSQLEQGLGHRINMILAISTEGFAWLALTQCNTDEKVMQMFLSRLTQVLTKELKGDWRDDVVLLMDGASYHRSAETRACIKHLRLQVVVSAPYSFSTAAAETWFAHFKRGDFNPEGIKTGKRYFREVSKLVFQHASAIPRERVTLFFRHAVLHLYGYLHFKPL